jgi:MoxR-like ATPase
MAWRVSHHESTALVLNEIDRGGDDVMSLLHAIVDDASTACLTLPTGETVRPGPHLTVIGTMNGDPDGLRHALRDRFAVRLCINTPAPGALEQFPASWREPITASMLDSEPATAVSLRTWQAYFHLAKRVGRDVAAEAVFGRRAGDLQDTLRMLDLDI